MTGDAVTLRPNLTVLFLWERELAHMLFLILLF
jgi:hypothetical protein